MEDGSPDKSGMICDELAKQDSRIVVIHKENGGAATARNAGLDKMRGAYVAFVDADDYMEPNYIETLYRTLNEHQAQVAVCGFKTVDEYGNRVVIDALHDDAADVDTADNSVKLYNGNEMILQTLQGHWEHVAPWGKLYCAQLFRGVRYPHWPAYEDEHVFIQIFDKVEKTALGKEKLYYYVQHTGSLMNTEYHDKQRTTRLTMWRERIAYYSDGTTKHKELYNCILQAYLAWIVLFLAQNAHKMTKEQSTELKQEIRKYFSCVFHAPHLYNQKESIKLMIKCILTLLNTDILGKRYIE